MRATGPEVTVFDWTTQKCASDDIPDQPTRAFRDSTGQVVLINSHHTVRRYTGPHARQRRAQVPHPDRLGQELGSVEVRQPGVARHDVHPERDQRLRHHPRRVPGVGVRAGLLHPPRRAVRGQAEVLVQRAHPRHLDQRRRELLAHHPSDALPGRPAVPVRGRDRPDRLLPAQQHRARRRTATSTSWCTPRTTACNLSAAACCVRTVSTIPARGASGTARASTGASGTRICTPIRPRRACARRSRRLHIGTLSESLTWSTYLKKWVLVGSADNADGVSGPGFYYFTSDDLVNWSIGEAPDERRAALDVPMPGRARAAARPLAARQRQHVAQLRHDRAAAVPVLHALQRRSSTVRRAATRASTAT